MSQTPRLYQNTELFKGQVLILRDSAHHYITNVLRQRKDQAIWLFNGRYGDFWSIITEQTKRYTQVVIQEYYPKYSASSLTIELAQVVARGDKMDWVIQKAVELGVSTITPLISARCGVKLPNNRWQKKYQHWQNIMISACEQCGRVDLPLLNQPINLSDWLVHCRAHYRIVLHPHYHQSVTKDKPINNLALLVGPEGGFNEQEIKLAQQYDFICRPLGPRILRTETAALVAMSQLQSLYGDLSDNPILSNANES